MWVNRVATLYMVMLYGGRHEAPSPATRVTVFAYLLARKPQNLSTNPVMARVQSWRTQHSYCVQPGAKTAPSHTGRL